MDATYDRELIAEMLAAAAHGGIHLFAMDAVMGQIAALRAADNRDAAGVDSEEDAYVIERMGKMLAEIAVIVNGPEPDMTRWSYHDLPEQVRALKTAPDAATVGEAVAWRHPDEVPEVVPGGNAYFWVAVRRKHDGRVYSFPAQYLNAMLLCNEWSDDTERSGNRYHHGPTCEVEGSFPATGWHDAKEHGEYDCVYQPLLGDADELVAWREVADYGATTPPTPSAGVEVTAPNGWAFHTADFSMVAAGRPGGRGRVELIRDAENRARWHALGEADRERVELAVYGHGMTFAEAFADACKNAALTAALEGGK